jgi:hypothetical protein
MNTIFGMNDWLLEQYNELSLKKITLTKEEEDNMLNAPASYEWDGDYWKDDAIEGYEGDYGFYYHHDRNPDKSLWYSFTTGEFEKI